MVEGVDSKPKVGLALSGGGSRGLAHIGVLKMLEREDIPVDFLAGTSMGGVIAAGYAAGLSPEFLAAEAQRMGQLRNLMALMDRSLPRLGLFEGQKVQEYLAGHLGDITFDELKIPLALVAVDLKTGEEVVLRSGRVVDAVRATISLPGVFAPFRLDGRLLVDGGVLNNLPADIVREMGADIVIAVDMGAKIEDLPRLLEAEKKRLPLTQIPLIVETLLRTVGIMRECISAQKLAQARPEVLIKPALSEDVGLFLGFNRVAECIAAGEEAAAAWVPVIRSALNNCRQQLGEAAMQR
ncbi:MAG: patatin-like phospholipase family protein [Anaerolineales bacterium]|nr:patatin-like phospholipase family protein [Anaerolineales bacterium]